jgi:hypothetical protein
MKKYLAPSEYIDWETPEVFAQAKELSSGVHNHEEIASNCFEFVRDEINHSWDYNKTLLPVRHRKFSSIVQDTATPKVICWPRCCAQIKFQQACATSV